MIRSDLLLIDGLIDFRRRFDGKTTGGQQTSQKVRQNMNRLMKCLLGGVAAALPFVLPVAAHADVPDFSSITNTATAGNGAVWAVGILLFSGLLLLKYGKRMQNTCGIR